MMMNDFFVYGKNFGMDFGKYLFKIHEPGFFCL